MPIKILMPALSPTMTEGNLTKWLKRKGDKILAGEVIAEIETDKATMEVEAVDEGVVAKLLVEEGTQGVAVNSLIAILIEEDEKNYDIDDFIYKNTSIPEAITQSSSPVVEVIEYETSDKKTSDLTVNKESSSELTTKIFASPLAKRMAIAEGIELSSIIGSGPRGRIVKADILGVKKDSTSIFQRNKIKHSLIPNSGMRKVIAKRLVESKLTIPHFYLSIECIMDDVLKLREEINTINVGDKNKKLSVNDFIILASAKSLKDVPSINASWTNSAIIMYNNIDISIAVSIDGGLITPIIQNADQKDINKISSEMKELVKKAKANTLIPEEFQGGGFSISNLGMYGVKKFSAIINPPQGCILSIGSSTKRPVVISEKIQIKTVMDVTLSCDHRVVDGVTGAKFLTRFKKYMESPILMFI